MKYLTIILLLIVTVITVKAQNKSQSQVDQLDELLFDSQYEEVIKRVDQYKASDPYQDIVVFNKKAEAAFNSAPQMFLEIASAEL